MPSDKLRPAGRRPGEPRDVSIADGGYGSPNTPPHPDGQVRHHVFGPPVIDVARFLATETGADVVSLMIEVDRRWPGLSVHKLLGAFELAQALAMQPRGSA
jgi:hypothetical protein